MERTYEEFLESKWMAAAWHKHGNLIGKRFGRLTVISEAPRRRGKNGTNYKYWVCKCDCGNVKEIKEYDFYYSAVKSCGCLWAELSHDNHKTTHGKSNTRLYGILRQMNKRCYDVNHQAYKNYGGRGITICDDWKGLDKIDNFIDWALSNGYSDDLTIDRIDNDGPYAPWNCRWVDRKTQNNNTRKTVYLTIDGVTKRESEWLKIYNLNKNTYRDRIHRGWDKVEAMTNPVNTKYSSTTGNRQATRGLNENE